MVEAFEKVEVMSDASVRQGKVRDVVDVGNKVALVATDRISAFDVVMPTLIPGKGELLSKISKKWFSHFKDVPSHICTMPSYDFLRHFGPNAFAKVINRCTVGHKADVIPIEFVVRGYMAGSLWKEYSDKRDRRGGWDPGQSPDWSRKQSNRISACGHEFFVADEKKQCEALNEPIFTPATKAAPGEHDENIHFDKADVICAEHFGMSNSAARQLMNELENLSISIYKKAHQYAMLRGIIIADTKFEFGFVGNKVVLIDELLTPDSSRFWLLQDYEIGRDQDSYDKQILRNYLIESGNRNKAVELPDEIVQKIVDRYQDIYDRLFGEV